MWKWIVPVLAAAALFGCQEAPEVKTVSPGTQPETTQVAPARPAPEPDVIVTIEEINAGKNEWVAAQAAQYHISPAEVERRAHFMRATPGMKVTVCGMSVTFTKTIWHSCEAALKAARTAQVQTALARDQNLVTLTRQQYNDLRAAAYENPEETDPTKLRGYREDAARLEVERDNLAGFTPTHGLLLALGIVLGSFSFWYFNRDKKTRTKERPGLPLEDPRSSVSATDSEQSERSTWTGL